MRELIVPSIGMMLLLSPMNWVHKIGVAAVFSVPSGVIVLLGVQENRRKQQDDEEAIAISTRQLEEAKKLKKEVEAREHELKQIHGGMKTLSEANTEKGLILAELAAKKQELKSLQAQFDAKKEKVEADLAHLVNLKLETEAERDRIINQAKLEGEDKARDYIRSLEAQLQQLVDMEHATRLELAREKHKLELEKLHQEKELERDRIVWETTKEQEEAKLTTEWANWLQEKEELREEWKQQVQDEINQQIDGEVEQRVQAVLNAQITAKTIPLLEDIERLKNQVATLRDRISGLLQEIAEIKKPQKFKGTEYNDLLGNQIIEWYWQKHHVGLNAKNRTWEGSTYILEVEPFEGVVKSDLYGKKNIIVDSLSWDFQLQSAPEIMEGSEGYKFYITPISRPANGVQPRVLSENERIERFERSYSVHQPESIEINYDDYGGAIEAIANQAKLDQMYSFVEPNRRPSGKGEITQIEILWVEWLVKWRYKVTRKPNIATINGLLKYLYNVSGRASYTKDAYTGWTLRERIHQILQRAQIDRKTLQAFRDRESEEVSEE